MNAIAESPVAVSADPLQAIPNIVGPSQARLRGLRRGCYDTFTAAHAAGVDVAIIRRTDLHLWTSSTYEKGAEIFLKVATATAMALQDLATVASTTLTLVNRTARPLPPMNLRANGVGVAPAYISGVDVLIEWDITSWNRHDFWSSWDEAYLDTLLLHKLKISAMDGTVVRKVGLAAGVTSYNYAQADLLADFGGTAPAAFRLDIFSRRRGFHSLVNLSLVIALAPASPVNPVPRTNWMAPSSMSQILGACDPETLVDRNFALCAAHFSLSLPATASQDEDGAPAAVQANFSTLAAALGLPLYPVSPSRNPEAATQANFELLNAAW